MVAKPANCSAFFRKVVFPCFPFLGFWKFVWESAEVGFNRSQELAVATITIHFTLGPSETSKMAKFILDIPRVLSREIAMESSNERLQPAVYLTPSCQFPSLSPPSAATPSMNQLLAPADEPFKGIASVW